MAIKLIFCVFIICSTAYTVSSYQIKLKVEQGWLVGDLVETVTGDRQYYSFKGIPYAKPPIGPLRFKAPQPPEPWTGLRDASKHGSVCPQVNILFNVYIPGSEDCLFLNVYTPRLAPPSLLPVMFFIHGGAYEFGSGDDDVYGPDFLVNKNVVLVTINYRLEALGFLSLGTKDVPGNAGLKDQHAALKWVKKNIKKFGGDPSQITIFGESAGAASVAFHMVSPMSKGLFKRAILQSGVPSMDVFLTYKIEERAFQLGKMLGFETKDVEQLHKFLLEVPYEKLVNVTCPVFASEEITSVIFKYVDFAPVIEKDLGQERFIVADPFVYLDSGDIDDIDMMLGYNSRESLVMLQFYTNWGYVNRYNRYPELFVPTKILVNSNHDTILDLSNKIIDHYFGNKSVSVSNMRDFLNYADMANVVYDVHRFIRRYPQRPNTYLYKFSGVSNRNLYGNQGAQFGARGTGHFEDIFYLFDPKSLKLPLSEGSREYKIINHITTVFTNFAKYGNPTPDASLGVIWPEFDKYRFPYVDIADNLTVGYAPDEEEVQFWKSILESAGIIF